MAEAQGHLHSRIRVVDWRRKGPPGWMSRGASSEGDWSGAGGGSDHLGARVTAVPSGAPKPGEVPCGPASRVRRADQDESA